MNPAAEDPRHGRRWHRRHRFRDADRGRLRRDGGLDQRRRSAPPSTKPGFASSTRARNASSAAGSRPPPRASTTSASWRPSRPTSRTRRAPHCPTWPTTPQVVVLQNGLCEERIAAIVGARARDRRDRRVGRLDAGARPLRAHGGGRVPDRPAVGRASTPTSSASRELLEAIGPVTLTTEPARRAVEQARAQLRGLRARHDRRRTARAARARAPLSPARARSR